MRWVHVTVVVLFAAITAIFAAQNFEIVTVSFLGFSMRMPLAFLVVLIYLVGMVTGGGLIGLLRRSIEGSRQRPVT